MAELRGPFSGVTFLSALDDDRLSVLDLPFTDVLLGKAGALARLSSSLTDDPEMVCLRYRSDLTLNVLLESSSRLKLLPLGLSVFTLPEVDEDGGFEAEIEGDW